MIITFCTWVSPGDFDAAEPPLKWPLDGVGENISGDAETNDLSLDLVLGGLGGRPRSMSWSSSEDVYIMKLSSRMLSDGGEAKEIFPVLKKKKKVSYICNQRNVLLIQQMPHIISVN